MQESPPSRPDPDALLRRVKGEEARERRAKLRIFFGFAPGVGKTYRMLQVARDQVNEGVDVVVGVVETHKRMDTAALVLGLELLPKKKIEYRGHVLEELDLDGALARKPEVLLVDELAHTNVPGAKHAKRWQDVLDLLDAGIDVYTTVNVQHVESLNDVVAQITHVQVRETIPDSILDRADVIELVDLSPEELLERLREGKVYLGEQAARATEHFFRRGNLLALRELALRRTAQRVDEDVLAYREEHGVGDTWPTRDRVLVCVGAAPSSARLVRAASRIAQRLHAPWVAAYVEPPAATLRASDRERLDTHLRLAESLGAQVVRLGGTDVATAVLAWARKHNVTRIVIGKPTHAWWRDRLRGSLLDAIVRGSGDIDVHVIAGDTAAESTASTEPRTAVSGERVDPRAWGAAVLIVMATTAVAGTLRAAFAVPDVEVLFFLAVMVAGALFGRRPSVLAAALGVLAYDFFFVPPFFTLAVADGRYVLTFVMMFAVGLLVSELVARIRRQEKDAIGREERTASLYALTRNLGAAANRADAARVLATHVAEALEADVFVFGTGDRGELEQLASQPPDAALDSRDEGVVKWAHEHGKLAGLGTDTLPGARIVACPLRASDAALGVVALQPRAGGALTMEQRDLLEVLCRQAALVFERSVLAEEAERAVLRARTEELRSSLLSAVSHDLRTPLAAITGAAATVRDETSLDAKTRHELLDTVCDEAERLERLVVNLLDMTRLESGAVVVRRDWVPIEELVGSALTRLERRLAGHEVHVDLAASPPLAPMDPILVEQVLVNLLENACKYTPEGTPIDIRARGEGETVVVEVSDRGAGLPPGDPSELFEKFHRGAGTTARGAGLGLAICRGIVTAHGGRIEAQDRAGGGATFRFTLPIEGAPPSLPPELREGTAP